MTSKAPDDLSWFWDAAAAELWKRWREEDHVPAAHLEVVDHPIGLWIKSESVRPDHLNGDEYDA